jgi:hypothetical protein
MSIVEQITKSLVDPGKHGPILKALVDILEEDGEKAAKDRIKKWIEEIQVETLPGHVSEE